MPESLRLKFLTSILVLRDFHPRVLLRLHRRLDAAANIKWERFWKTAHPMAYIRRRPGNSWENLKVWLRMWHGGGLALSFSVLLSVVSGAGRRGWFVVGGLFRLVDWLRGFPWSVVEGLGSCR